MAVDGRERDSAGSDGEVDELRFLVGTACSRLINLLMNPGAARGEIAEEAAFLAERAGRLAGLLSDDANG
ncbi:MAG: hypothetical protein KKA32_14210 [Actinobacteria bacterium]|nr:hypothetical protein [Actinomycetota bacterium]